MRLGKFFRWFLLIVLALAGVFAVSFGIVYFVAMRDKPAPPATGPFFPTLQTTDTPDE